MVDFHNHVIPGVDDGATDDRQAAAALQVFAEHGFDTIVATPHVSGSLTLRDDALGERLAEIDVGWRRIEAIASEQFPSLRVLRGAEVMLDTPNLVLEDERLRLAGGRFALVEFPYMTVPPQSHVVLQTLVRAGITPIIAHPERYVGMAPNSGLPVEWRRAGALLQINAGSVTGRYGPHARETALGLLERGLADYLCSDFHARGRPSTRHALELLAELGAEDQGELLVGVNPRRLLEGDQPVPVPALPRQTGLMQRLRQWLK
ncbi:tyrosine protein phosphatase [soil metagenome]